MMLLLEERGWKLTGPQDELAWLSDGRSGSGGPGILPSTKDVSAKRQKSLPLGAYVL